MIRRAATRGFTLLETMVTLVIVSLMIAMLMQAMIQVLALRDRVMGFQRESRVGALQEQWFRESMEGAIVDLADARGWMAGDAREVSFVSADLPSGDGIGRVAWRIVGDARGDALVFVDAAGRPVEAIAGPLQGARFAYGLSDGTWAAEWAPPAEAEEVLPRLVRFTAQGARADIDWVVPLRVSPAPPSAFLRAEAGAID